jgi:hypothetical protein
MVRFVTCCEILSCISGALVLIHVSNIVLKCYKIKS